MSKAPYTPGPWHWDGNNLKAVLPNPEGSAVHTILADDGMGAYGYIGSDVHATLAEQEGNLRLIAAAPELLHALELAYGHIEEDSLTRVIASAAIAKAKGGAA